MNQIAKLFAERAAATLIGREGDDPKVRAARDDRNNCCEYCFKDNKGNYIKQAPHHRIWQDATGKYRRLVMWYPIGHGKTTQTKMTLCDLLGEHGDRQYAYIASKKPSAEKVVGAVKREIESNERLHRVYPNLKPQIQTLSNAYEMWGTTRFRVAEAPRGLPDPSLTAYGLESNILGSRLHGVIIDNGLDSSNTSTEELRKKFEDLIKDEIIGRLDPDIGFIWLLDTAWFEDDFMHQFAKKEGWHSIKLDAEVPLREEDGTLWPAMFDREKLDERLRDLGQTAYDRQYRNKPLSETMDYFKEHYWKAAYDRCEWVDDLSCFPPAGFNMQCQLVTAIDLAIGLGQEHDLTVFASVVASGIRRKLIHMQSDRLISTDIIKALMLIYKKIHLPIIMARGSAKFVVENNAAQQYIVDMCKDPKIQTAYGLTKLEAANIIVEGRTTTSEKRDQDLGIPGLAAGFEMGRWDVAANSETDQLREEMRTYSPGKHSGDRLMATWIAYASLIDARAEFVVRNA